MKWKIILQNLRFISSFTIGTIYEKVIQDLLVPSLEKFCLPYHIFAKPDLGEWKINSRQRPLYIKEAMEMFSGENILWIDADAKVMKYPELLFHIPEFCQVGVCYLDWTQHYGRESDKGKTEILDGTSFYKNSPEMILFMDEWIERSVHQNQNHRRILDHMIKERISGNLELFMIPRDYCYILTKPDGSAPAVPIKDCFIAHFQASRLARNNLYDDNDKNTPPGLKRKD